MIVAIAQNGKKFGTMSISTIYQSQLSCPERMVGDSAVVKSIAESKLIDLLPQPPHFISSPTSTAK